MSYVMVLEEDLEKLQKAYKTKLEQIDKAIVVMEKQNNTIAQAKERIVEQKEILDKAMARIDELVDNNTNMHVLITALVQASSGEVVVRIKDYNDCAEGKHVLSRRDGIQEGDAVFMTRELPSSPLWLSKDKIIQ